MGYFKQQNKDLTTWCINGINQPKIVMIYGGFQSMGVPLNHPFRLGVFPWKPTSYWGSPMTMEPPPLWKTAWDKPNDRWIHWILLVLVPSTLVDLGFVTFQNPKPMGWDVEKPMLSITWTSDLMLKHGPTGDFFAFSLPSTNCEKDREAVWVPEVVCKSWICLRNKAWLIKDVPPT